jgi:Mn-dependent DtxR family transcriptional regulator
MSISPQAIEVHQQLLEDGFIERDGRFWNLTEKGREAAEKELDRYRFKPGLRFLICMRNAELFGIKMK